MKKLNMMTKLSVVIGGVAMLAAVETTTATTIDVTTIGSSGSLNGATFYGIDPQSTGTGVIDPFLRMQNNGMEFGVNTSQASNGNPFDDKGGIYTHDVAVSALATFVGPGGTLYYSFFLDANQVGNGTISLTTMKIFTSPTALGTVASVVALTGGTPVYDMGAGNRVDIAGNNGSGSGDMNVYVPASLIGNTGYLYLYAGFGESGYEGNDGFEEWRAQLGQNNYMVPDGGSTLFLLGLTGLGMFVLARRQKIA